MMLTVTVEGGLFLRFLCSVLVSLCLCCLWSLHARTVVYRVYVAGLYQRSTVAMAAAVETDAAMVVAAGEFSRFAWCLVAVPQFRGRARKNGGAPAAGGVLLLQRRELGLGAAAAAAAGGGLASAPGTSRACKGRPVSAAAAALLRQHHHERHRPSNQEWGLLLFLLFPFHGPTQHPAQISAGAGALRTNRHAANSRQR